MQAPQSPCRDTSTRSWCWQVVTDAIACCMFAAARTWQTYFETSAQHAHIRVGAAGLQLHLPLTQLRSSAPSHKCATSGRVSGQVHRPGSFTHLAHRKGYGSNKLEVSASTLATLRPSVCNSSFPNNTECTCRLTHVGVAGIIYLSQRPTTEQGRQKPRSLASPEHNTAHLPPCSQKREGSASSKPCTT